MLNFLANSFLYRRLGRAIPNPILRSLAIAGVGMAARRVMARRAASRAAGGATTAGPRVGRAPLRPGLRPS